MSRRQGIFWIFTIPHAHFTPFLPESCQWIRGQLELGTRSDADGGGRYLHWQLVLAFKRKQSINFCKREFGDFHAELTKSDAASEYVWKEETRIQGTQFELGAKPIQRNSSKDWDDIWEAAIAGDLLRIPASVRVQSYASIRRIQGDFAQPIAMQRQVLVFWGDSGTGKSLRAWTEAGMDAYSKDPRSKFWCGYRGQAHVVIDEFNGDIDIAHLLRWLDCYPINVETKGGSVPLKASAIWLTSNRTIEEWYPNATAEQIFGIRRRCTITHYQRGLALTQQ